MIYYEFGGKDGGSDSGCFTIIIAATSLTDARNIAKQHLLSQQREDLLPALSLIQKAKEPILFSDIENGT